MKKHYRHGALKSLLAAIVLLPIFLIASMSDLLRGFSNILLWPAEHAARFLALHQVISNSQGSMTAAEVAFAFLYLWTSLFCVLIIYRVLSRSEIKAHS